MNPSIKGVALVVFATVGLAACGGPAAGKAELVSVCQSKLGSNSGEKCECFATNLEGALSEDNFAKLAGAIDDSKRLSGDWIPGPMRSNAAMSGPITEASVACF